jgi:hypothetical protein
VRKFFLYLLPGVPLALYLSYDFFNISCTCKWICIIFSTKFSSFNASPCDVFPHSSLFSINNIQGKRWKISKASFKRGLTSRSMDYSVIRVLNVDHIFIPGLWMLLIVTPQKLYQILLTTYVFASIYGWNVVDLFNLVSIFSQSVVQKALRNMVSLSKMMLLGIPKCTQTYSKNMFVSSCPLMVFLQGIRMHILLNLSTTTNR